MIKVNAFRVPFNGVTIDLSEEQARALSLAGDSDWHNAQNAIRQAMCWTPPEALVEIEKRVCAWFGRLPHELHGASRAQHVNWPRQLVMYYASRSAGSSRQDIMRYFERSYDTVRTTVRLVADTFANNSGTARSLAPLTAEINTLCAQWRPAVTPSFVNSERIGPQQQINLNQIKVP